MMPDEDDDVGAMLATPLPAVADEGFSLRVAARMAAMEKHDWAWEIAGVSAALAFVFVFVPLAGLMHTSEILAFDLGSSMPLAVACAALVLSQFLARVLTDQA